MIETENDYTRVAAHLHALRTIDPDPVIDPLISYLCLQSEACQTDGTRDPAGQARIDDQIARALERDHLGTPQSFGGLKAVFELICLELSEANVHGEALDRLLACLADGLQEMSEWEPFAGPLWAFPPESSPEAAPWPHPAP